jgi:uncharacterized membrane protein
MGPQAVAWDDVARTARYINVSGEKFSGTVVYVRPHDTGVKVNLVFENLGRSWEGNQVQYEFIVFPVGDKFRILGMMHKLVGGQRYLDRLEQLSTLMTCVRF